MTEPIYNSDLIRGHVDTFILRVLADGDNYGYHIIKEISLRSGNRFELKEPTLYASLRRLEKQGFIRSYWGEETQGGRRKYYNLSQEGHARLQQNQEEWRAVREIIDVLIETGKEMS